jgi:RNA:NAD 2'-phosphotransferase (TPT1/KptA family)
LFSSILLPLHSLLSLRRLQPLLTRLSFYFDADKHPVYYARRKKNSRKMSPPTKPIKTTPPASSTAPTADVKKNNSRNRGPRGDSPAVRLSKALSWLLRHNAVSQGIMIRPDGYVKITAVLGHPKFKDFTLDDIIKVVETNEKKRFEILEDDEGQKVYIRAVQGHSIAAVSFFLNVLLDEKGKLLLETVGHGR